MSSALPDACLTASPTRLLISVISAVIFATDSVLLFASFPISDATTAKPFPASPARAASIEAFNDNKFVSSAISPIRLIICTISPDAFPTLFTAASRLCIDSSILSRAMLTRSISCLPFSDMATVSFIFCLTRLLSSFVSDATPASCVAFSAISFTERESWSTVVFSSPMDCDCIDAAEFISLETSLLESACSLSFPEMLPISFIICFIFSINFFTLYPITAISSLPFTSIVTVKSPDDIWVIIFVIFFTGLITMCVTRSISTHNRSMHTTLITIITIRR